MLLMTAMVLFIFMINQVTPIRVCFVDDKDANKWWEFDLFFDIYFGLDIILNFISAYYDHNSQLIYNFKDIIYNYFTGWFIIDLISIFPFDLISNSSNADYQKLVRLMRLPRLSRLTKIIRLSRAGNN